MKLAGFKNCGIPARHFPARLFPRPLLARPEGSGVQTITDACFSLSLAQVECYSEKEVAGIVQQLLEGLQVRLYSSQTSS